MDKIIRQNQKARWGFSGTSEQIIVAPQSVGETGGTETVDYRSDNDGAHYNGGGAEPAKRGRKSKKVAPEDQE